MYTPLWYLMREAAFARHRLLVNAWFPEGPRREEEHRRHIAIVKLVYGA